MFTKTLEDAMNEQIKNELDSAYIYLAMSAEFEATNLPGFAHWMRLQAQEEVEHAMKFFDFINDRGGRVSLLPINQPPFEWKTPLQAFQSAYEHEQKVTGMINNLYEMAVKEKDYPSQIMLQWFIDEQVEEEKNASAIVEQLKMIDGKSPALLYLDKQLAKRNAEEE